MKETVPLTETLFHFLLEEKGKRLQTLQTDSHARLHLERSPLGVTVSGVQEAVTAAKTALEAMTQTVETMTESVPVTSAQVERLLQKKGEVLRRLQKEQKCLLELRRKEGVVLLTAPEESRAAAKAALETVLASVCVETAHLARRQVPLFVGPQGANIKSVREASGASLEVARDGELTVSGEEAAVAKAMELVRAWLEAHAVEELTAPADAAFAVAVGPKGSKRRALEKELGVELDVSEKEGTATITVLGEQEKLKAAATALQDLLATYERENASVTFSASELRRAPELRRAALSEKMKALGAETTVVERRGVISVHSSEHLSEAVAYLESLRAKYAEYEEMPLAVAKEAMGTLVGKRGENIRRLQETLGVVIDTDKDAAVVWGPKASLATAVAQIEADLEERLQVTESVPCSVTQLTYLSENRHALANRIQELSGAEVRVPRELPALGSAAVTVRGNKRQVACAVPLVREALQGLVRETFSFAPEELTAALHESSLQVQRLALESRSRIVAKEAEGSLTVVGPKEGVALALRRIWQALAAAVPDHFAVVALGEAAALGLATKEKELASYAKDHAVLLRHDNEGLYIRSNALSETETWARELCARCEAENAVVTVGRARVPYLIGSHGSRIQQLRKTSGAALEVVHEDALWLQGSAEAVAKGRELVAAAVAEYDATHHSVKIDPAYIGVLVGVRGSNLARLRQQFQVSISVEDDGEVKVAGQQTKQVEEAIAAVEKCVAEAKERDALEEPRPMEMRRMEMDRAERLREEKPKETVTGESVWEKLKRAPLLPAASKKSEVDKLLGLKNTVGGSESYKSESGYTVEL